MTAFLPPISQTTFLTCGCSSGVTPAAWRMSRPTALEPVKAMSAMRGSRTRAAPTVSPTPGRKCSTSFGTPASHSREQSTCAMPGVCSAGLTMTVLPVTRAATVMPQQIASGKFQGLMTTATPRGW